MVSLTVYSVVIYSHRYLDSDRKKFQNFCILGCLRAYLIGGDVAATAATDQSRQLGRLGRPKNGLHSHQGDVAETYPDKVTTNSSSFWQKDDHSAILSSRPIFNITFIPFCAKLQMLSFTLILVACDHTLVIHMYSKRSIQLIKIKKNVQRAIVSFHFEYSRSWRRCWRAACTLPGQPSRPTPCCRSTSTRLPPGFGHAPPTRRCSPCHCRWSVWCLVLKNKRSRMNDGFTVSDLRTKFHCCHFVFKFIICSLFSWC